MEQTITQTINLNVQPGAPDTGLGLASSLTSTWMVLVMFAAFACAAWILLRAARRAQPQRAAVNARRTPSSAKRRGSAGRFLALVLAFGFVASVCTYALPGTNPQSATAAAAVTLSTDLTDIAMDITNAGGAKTIDTSVTVATTQQAGYTLTAAVKDAEAGIAVALKGGNLTTTTTLTDTAQTLKTTQAATAGSGDTLPLQLSITVDPGVAPGEKQLKIVYVATAHSSLADTIIAPEGGAAANSPFSFGYNAGSYDGFYYNDNYDSYASLTTSLLGDSAASYNPATVDLNPAAGGIQRDVWVPVWNTDADGEGALDYVSYWTYLHYQYDPVEDELTITPVSSTAHEFPYNDPGNFYLSDDFLYDYLPTYCTSHDCSDQYPATIQAFASYVQQEGMTDVVAVMPDRIGLDVTSQWQNGLTEQWGQGYTGEYYNLPYVVTDKHSSAQTSALIGLPLVSYQGVPIS